MKERDCASGQELTLKLTALKPIHVAEYHWGSCKQNHCAWKENYLK